MNGPEDGIHRVGIGLAILDCEKPGLQFGELLRAFLEKGLPDFLHRIHRLVHPQQTVGPNGRGLLATSDGALPDPEQGYAATRLMASTSLVGSKGLTIQPVAPARRARCFFSPSLSVVRTRIGMAR